MGPVAWTPDEQVQERAQLTRFLRSNGLSSFAELHRFSVTDIPAFTTRVLEFLRIQFQRPYSQILDLSAGEPWARWCVGGGLNISESCLGHDPARPAVIWEGEEGTTRTLSYGDLTRQVHAVSAGLRKLGIRKGDAIAIHLPMIPETVIALIAAARIGAVAVPLFSGYGPAAIEARIRDVEAKVVITCDAFPRRGKLTPAKSVVDQAVKNCPSVDHVVVVNRLGTATGLLWDSLICPAPYAVAEPT